MLSTLTWHRFSAKEYTSAHPSQQQGIPRHRHIGIFTRLDDKRQLHIHALPPPLPKDNKLPISPHQREKVHTAPPQRSRETVPRALHGRFVVRYRDFEIIVAAYAGCYAAVAVVDDAGVEECEACSADLCGGDAAEGFGGAEDDLEEAEAVGWGN